MSGHNILSELLDNDTGLESPNPSTGFLLKKLGLGSFQLLIPDIGYAYGWAQSICGVNFLTPKVSCFISRFCPFCFVCFNCNYQYRKLKMPFCALIFGCAIFLSDCNKKLLTSGTCTWRFRICIVIN